MTTFNVTCDGNTVTNITLSSSGGSTTFVGLIDTPSSYSGEGGNFLKVKSDESAIEFASSSGNTYNTESKAGSDCSGSDGDTSRVLTLANTSTTLSGEPFKVFVEGLLIMPSNLTISHKASGTTITFADSIYDTDRIFIEYYT